jgi:SAM-dependent methyltransferase
MTQTDGDYDDWAWLYNKTLGPEYREEKLDFLERTLIARTPIGGRILDLCCGTGQMIPPLVERGFAVTGLDYSADMLRHARQNAPGIEFVQGDARSFRFAQPFDGVLCTSASLNHMSTLEDLAQVFACVRENLIEGGTFVFDINHPAQLVRYWRGQPAEGEIRRDYAWLITPRYDAEAAKGGFTVDMYRRPANAAASSAKDLLGTLLGARLLRRRRLALLARFRGFRPDWEHRSNFYPIHGHDLAAVEALLRRTGFDVSLETVCGDKQVDEHHAAHFVCRKTRVAVRPADARQRAPQDVQAGSAP